jgi:MFS family permease
MAQSQAVGSQDFAKEYNIWSVIGASSAGTLIEWYDFYIFGSLATVINTYFFPKDNEAFATVATLATFATGFIVRPFGAIVFGRLGDLVGRKFTFLLTLLLMGGSTFAIGLLPGYEQVGVLAPILLLTLRLLQGLALGGEYGGAATYIAEHCPDEKRGYYTSYIQTTATLGLFVSLGVILITRQSIGEAMFKEWGWRIPFLISILLVVISYFIRIRMQESPMFARMKASGKTSKNPLKESFGNWFNLKFVLIALFGATMGQGVVWYTGQFYAYYYLQTILKIEYVAATQIISIALLLGTPFFIFFGWLSDRIGRKWIILVGCLIAAVSYIPIYQNLINAAGYTPEYIKSNAAAVTPVLAGKIAKQTPLAAQATAETQGFFSFMLKPDKFISAKKEVSAAEATIAGLPNGEFSPALAAALGEAKLAPKPDSGMLIFWIFIQVLFVTMVYGPIAAFLVEMFPTRIRYTSMSLPYHIGNGIFGGLLPTIGAFMVINTGNEFAGLWYPIIVASITVVVGAILVKDTRDVKLWDEMESMRDTGQVR